ncbi:hypothetical protein PV728_07995 [Streptomyces europaeiscabiei]|uniref:hypothetical protein n=1 Tax=Streptomyces europaeiscabiei TaxID=146819 RepID=UPI0029BF0E40|nr:hypothetical protein [Streptomyces europaeiscabiei]MDX3630245.1 hypothetical protein [Streptomyces europaeiscabiei]MDX3652497.1 hypothetical protein [Streptomyces europaeiscabiei]
MIAQFPAPLRGAVPARRADDEYEYESCGTDSDGTLAEVHPAAIGTPSPTASPTCRGRRPRGRLVEVTGRQEYAGADPNGWNIAREVSADAADHRNAPHGTATHRTAPRRVGTAPHRAASARHRTAPRRHGTAPAPHRTAPAPHRTAPRRHRTAPHRAGTAAAPTCGSCWLSEDPPRPPTAPLDDPSGPLVPADMGQ